MKTEIVVVLIASVASLIVGIINIVFNTKISAKQNEIELKKTRIDLLESRRQKIETVKTSISNRVIDLSDVKEFVFELHYPRIVGHFQENSNSILSIGHLLNSEFIQELKSLNRRISEYILQAKQQKTVNETEAKRDVELISVLSDRMSTEIDISLLEIEKQINILLK